MPRPGRGQRLNSGTWLPISDCIAPATRREHGRETVYSELGSVRVGCSANDQNPRPDPIEMNCLPPTM